MKIIDCNCRITLLLALIIMSPSICFGQASARINKTWIEYNVVRGGEKGMVIHTDFSVSGMKGRNIDVTVWFNDEDGNPLKGDGKYSNNGRVCTYTKQAPSYEDSHFSDWDSFIPYYALGFKQGKHNYYCFVNIYDDNFNIIGKSSNLSFQGTGGSNPSNNDNSLRPTKSNLIDNSEKIRITKSEILKYESEKKHCVVCHGSGYTSGTMCIACSGSGRVRTGYNPPLYANCSFCQGRGRNPQKCTSCMQTDLKIAGIRAILNFLEKSHGMTQDQYEAFCQSENYRIEMNKADREFMRTINSMSSSVNSSSSSSSSCSICHGTGIDPFAWESGDIPRGGAYTNPSGSTCPYCNKHTWHQHKYCPKCNANKY